MGPLQPSLGLFFWSLLIFLTLFFLLRKMAWKPIMKAIHDREDSIQGSIDEAKKVREEMANLKAENEALLAEARAERDKMLREARAMGEEILSKSRNDADDEYKRTMEKALEEIRAEKMRALVDVKNQVATLSIEVAEKILRSELTTVKTQQEVVDRYVGDLNLN